MNNHQSLKAEIDAREENFNACISLGRDLLNRKHYASSEIEKKLIKLTTERAEMMRRWEDRWEYLQLSEFLVIKTTEGKKKNSSRVANSNLSENFEVMEVISTGLTALCKQLSSY